MCCQVLGRCFHAGAVWDLDWDDLGPAVLVRHFSAFQSGTSGASATVADAAGLSQGVTVFYFKTKQALLAEALRWHYEECPAIWQAALAAAP